MAKILAILKSDLSLGFSLAGVNVRPCANQRDQLNALKETLEKKDVGMVIVDEEFMDSLDSLVRKDLLQRTKPLVVPIPGTLEWRDTEEVSRDDLIHRLIRQAVGYQLNIQF